MQSLLDVCYEYGTDNDILFNSIKSVCTVFKPKAYKRFTPTVFIGDDSKCDDSDMLRQMRLLYANLQSLTHYYGHLVIVHRTIKLLCFKAIVRHCIVLFCGTIIKSLHLVKFVSRLTMLIEKYLVFLSGVVLVQCMQLIIFVTLRQCYVRPYMVLCKDCTIALTL